MIEAVVFDIDDTLYDATFCYDCANEAVANYFFEQYGMNRDIFEEIFHAARQTVKNQLGEVAASHNRLLYIQTFLENIKLKTVPMALELYDQYWNTALSNMKPYPYVLPLMRRLKEKRIVTGFLSDLTAQIQHRKLKKLELSSFVDYLVTSEEAGKEKPSKEIFDLLLKKIGKSPDVILMIGDNKKKDMAGALSAGMQTLLFEKNHMDDMGDIIMRLIEND